MTFDSDGYPTDDTLKEIKDFKLGNHLENLQYCLDLVFGHWNYNCWKYNPETGCLQMSTAGWSGNESIIQSMKGNMFWMLFWEKSQRGGHYWFELFQFTDEGKKCLPKVKI